MHRQSWQRTWRLATAVVALAAGVMALYVQLFEVQARQEESRLAALRLESALAESRSRLKAEILAELLAGEVKASPNADGNEGPAPGAVLRRPESGRSATGAVRPDLEPMLPAPPLTLSGLAVGLQELSQESRETDSALRRDLEEFQAATRRELDAGAKATTLTIVAVILLALFLLLSFWHDTDAAPEGKHQVAVAGGEAMGERTRG